MRFLNDIVCIRAVLAVFTTAALFSACNHENPPAFSQFIPVENAIMYRDQWFEFDTRKDTLFRPQASERYDVIIQVRSTTDFPHQILWLATEMADSAGNVSTDTVGIRLCEPNGRRIGHGTRGLYITAQALLENVSVTPGYTFSVSQAMKEKETEGITDVGLVILQHTPQNKTISNNYDTRQ